MVIFFYLIFCVSNAGASRLSHNVEIIKRATSDGENGSSDDEEMDIMPAGRMAHINK